MPQTFQACRSEFLVRPACTDEDRCWDDEICSNWWDYVPRYVQAATLEAAYPLLIANADARAAWIRGLERSLRHW